MGSTVIVCMTYTKRICQNQISIVAQNRVPVFFLFQIHSTTRCPATVCFVNKQANSFSGDEINFQYYKENITFFTLEFY